MTTGWWTGVAALGTVAVFPLVEILRVAVNRPEVTLYGDQALVALGARRAAAFSQLLGPYSRTGFHHPGPAMFYLLAPFVNLLGSSGAGLYVGALAINLAAMLASVGLLWRRAGPRTALWGAVAIDLFALALGVGTLREPWNPYLVVMPMLLFLLLWAVAMSGSIGSAAWAVVVGSYEIQTHIATTVVVVALSATLVVRVIRSSRSHARPTARFGPAAWIGASTFAAMWVPPVIELFRDHPNNLASMWDFFTSNHQTVNPRQLVGIAGDSLTVLPFGNHDYVLALHRGSVELLAAAAMLAIASWATVRLATRCELDLPIFLLIGAVVTGGLGTLSLSASDGPVYLYFALWLSVVPLVALIGFGTALPGEGPFRAARGAAARWSHGSVMTSGLLVAALFVSAGATVSDLALPSANRTIGSGPWPPADAGSARGRHRTVADTAKIDEAVLGVVRRSDRTVELNIASGGLWPYAAGLVLTLDESGIKSRVASRTWVLYFGDQFVKARVSRLQLGLYPDTDPSAIRGLDGKVLVHVDGAVLTYRSNT